MNAHNFLEKETTLTFKNEDSEDVTIRFGIVKDKSFYRKIYEQRYRVYSARGYLNTSMYKEPMDIDEYDKDDQSTYAVALLPDQRLLGSVRLIESNELPMEKFFDFKPPKEAQDNKKICEISRIVVERKEVDYKIPRNIIMLFLANAVLDEAREKGIEIGYAYLKEKLLKKLSLLKFPVSLIDNSNCKYDPNGPMFPYFNSKEDPVYPSYFTLSTVEDYFESLLNNKHIFKKTEAGYYLNQNMFNSFLTFLKIL